MATEMKELEAMLDKMKNEQTPENSKELTRLLKEARVFIPAALPPDTSPEILKSITEDPNTPKPIPEGANPKPCILLNKDGKNYFPVFTSEAEINKGEEIAKKYPMTLNVNFDGCMNVIIKTPEIEGVVINPFNQNVVMNLNRNVENKNSKKTVKVTQEQFHAILRQQIEAREIPRKLFNNGAEFVEDLTKRQGDCLMEIFNTLYEDTKNCPYTADDFEFMVLNISDTMQLIRITMPDKFCYAGNGINIFITWNPVEEASKYFVIVKTENDNPARLLQVNPVGKATDHGVAPEEGNELQHIINIAAD